MLNFINGLPKAELHLHIEGTLNPELMFKIAKRNNIKIKYNSIDGLKKAYDFGNLQDFLNLYYQGAEVLIQELDFYEMTWEYLEKAHIQNVLHCEIFFDPQTHTTRGVAFATVINGIYKAMMDAENKFGISSKLILCFLRDMDEESAIKTLHEALPHKDKIIAVGLDSAEVGNPPSKFKNVFNLAHQEGFLTVAHAGEEGPADYVWEALEHLRVSRIDHGNNSMDDEALIDELAKSQMPLTVCPLSNLKLKVVDDLKNHPLRKMIEKNLLVTINSDDPAYFGGYINENYLAIAEALDLSKEEIGQLAKNSFKACFFEDFLKEKMIAKVDEYLLNYNQNLD
ncbi:MAG: adenosine deaminase [Ignavibacteria bacterium]|nr:adenosine deaminase [Ignavibacteria bacterium]